jgi:hypothetical protein
MSGTSCEALQAGAATTAPLGNPYTVKQKREGWEKAVRTEKILFTALHEAHERRVEEEVIEPPLPSWPERFCRSYLR